MTPPLTDGRTVSAVPQGPFRDELIQLMGRITVAQKYAGDLSQMATSDRHCILADAIVGTLGQCSLALSQITGFAPGEGADM